MIFLLLLIFISRIMSEFVSDNKISVTITEIIREAKDYVWLISPYIKLHHTLQSALNDLKEKPFIQLIVVFGKNEEDFTKSFSSDEIEFFKSLPNIQIYYEPRLHAKYYANEKKGLITSMNLYAFSQNENKEVGIVIDNSAFRNSNKYFEGLLRDATLVYDNEPEVEVGSFFSGDKYIKSVVKCDKLLDVKRETNSQYTKQVSNAYSKKQVDSTKQEFGYCIRTGVRIELNYKKPFSDEAYKSWLKFKNEEYKEKYCHFSGEESLGETSFKKPVLKKYWNKVPK